MRQSSPASTIPVSMPRAPYSTAPVVGIGEAAFHMATLIAGKFSVVTTLSRSVPGDRAQPRPLRAGQPVPQRARERRAGAGAGRSRIGCAARASRRRSPALSTTIAPRRSCSAVPAWRTLAAALSDEHGVPVVDGVAAAVKLAEGLVALGLRTSRVGGYQRPGPKKYAGRFANHSPGSGAPGPHGLIECRYERAPP